MYAAEAMNITCSPRSGGNGAVAGIRPTSVFDLVRNIYRALSGGVYLVAKNIDVSNFNAATNVLGLRRDWRYHDSKNQSKFHMVHRLRSLKSNGQQGALTPFRVHDAVVGPLSGIRYKNHGIDAGATKASAHFLLPFCYRRPAPSLHDLHQSYKLLHQKSRSCDL